MTATLSSPTSSHLLTAPARAGAVLDFFGQLPKISWRVSRGMHLSLLIDTDREVVSMKEDYL